MTAPIAARGRSRSLGRLSTGFERTAILARLLLRHRPIREQRKRWRVALTWIPVSTGLSSGQTHM